MRGGCIWTLLLWQWDRVVVDTRLKASPPADRNVGVTRRGEAPTGSARLLRVRPGARGATTPYHPPQRSKNRVQMHPGGPCPIIFCLPHAVVAIPSRLFMAEMTFAPESTAAETAAPLARPFAWTDRFVTRHIGPNAAEVRAMLKVCGLESLDDLVAKTVPASIRHAASLNLPAASSEFGLLQELRGIAAQNQIFKSYIGMGYSDTITPPVIQRCVIENPDWYTPYTPYQAEISQGRLEALLNFQTMVTELSGMDIANASLLDEGTAAAEAMTMAHGLKGNADNSRMFVSDACHPQTIDLLQTRARAQARERPQFHFIGEKSALEHGILHRAALADHRVPDDRDRKSVV